MKICAIIVTRNRLDCLRHCLTAVQNQTRQVDEIIVVNNGSTDGTADWLQSQPDIIAIHQDNTGGAGGFHTGIALGLSRQNDWLWCMDDDGWPEQQALKHLYPHCHPSVAALNSVTVSPLKPERLSFGMPRLNAKGYPRLWLPVKTLDELKRMADHNGLVPFGSFFNGTLLNGQTVRQVGNVNKALFIWGDELDLAWRLMQQAPIYTVIHAIHFHPEPCGPMKPWKFYYRLRNGIYINHRHLNHRFARNSLLILRSLVYLILHPASLTFFTRALIDGFSNKLGKTIIPD